MTTLLTAICLAFTAAVVLAIYVKERARPVTLDDVAKDTLIKQQATATVQKLDGAQAQWDAAVKGMTRDELVAKLNQPPDDK
jgi:molybdopterin-guanine dinucleotide biosynthesis protein